MEKKSISYGVYASAICRYANRNYDLHLRDLPIGSGQQFFLLRIYENEGISLYGLAQMGHFDKATVSRSVQKLVEAGYIRVIPDENDRRCRHLYVTEAAMPIIQRLLCTRAEWNQALTSGFTEEECIQLEILMQKMVQNAKSYIQAKEEKICSKEY